MKQNQIIRNIYLMHIQDIGADELSLLEKEEILGEIEYLKKDVSWKRYEKLRDTVFRIASAGEEAGFIRGFRYAVNLLMECME